MALKSLLVAALIIAGLRSGAAAELKHHVLYAFHGGTDAESPRTALTYYKGALYGTTPRGGATDNGTIFKYVIASGIESVVYSFTNGPADGGHPSSQLVLINNTLCGAAATGGAFSAGTIYCLAPDTGNLSDQWDFGGVAGASPAGPILKRADYIYGTTTRGGAQQCDCGVVYRVTLLRGREEILTTFLGGSDGAYPSDGVAFSHGQLYGTTLSGGQAGCGAPRCGTLFNIDLPPSRSFHRGVVHRFGGGPDGAGPGGPLLDIGGQLIGATSFGGAANQGVFYSVDPATAAYAALQDFTADEGTRPSGPLSFHRGNALANATLTIYGSTEFGGAHGRGDVYAYATNGGSRLTVLYSFKGGVDGAEPLGGLIVPGRVGYGTTASGGTFGHGTIFEIYQ
jgi:uncharacterized repeat protein (TIGR03803 family)